ASPSQRATTTDPSILSTPTQPTWSASRRSRWCGSTRSCSAAGRPSGPSTSPTAARSTPSSVVDGGQVAAAQRDARVRPDPRLLAHLLEPDRAAADRRPALAGGRYAAGTLLRGDRRSARAGR